MMRNTKQLLFQLNPAFLKCKKKREKKNKRFLKKLIFKFFREKNKRGNNWAQSLRPEQHLDAVPSATPINRNRINPKKRTFPLW